MSTAATQAATCDQTALYFRGKPGPKPKTKEALWLADRLVEAAATLRLVDQHRDRFAAIVREEGQ